MSLQACIILLFSIYRTKQQIKNKINFKLPHSAIRNRFRFQISDKIFDFEPLYERTVPSLFIYNAIFKGCFRMSRWGGVLKKVYEMNWPKCFLKP